MHPCPPARPAPQSEHERYLTEEVFQAPIIVYNYPKEIKAREGGRGDSRGSSSSSQPSGASTL